MILPQMMYNEITEDCFFNPRHVGRIDIAKPNTAHVRVNKSGLAIALYLEYSTQRIIKKACFKASGNPYVIGCLEWLCRQIEGLSLDELPEINYQLFVKVLAIPIEKYPSAVQVDFLFKELIKRCQ